MRGAALILGTRGSALALVQVELVKQALRAAHPAIEIEVKKITTSGDRRQQERVVTKPTGAGLKGMFTKEIEEALLAGEIDVAVHSLKDLPGRLPDGVEVMAVLARAATNDVLISKTAGSFDELPPSARIGTSSVRRRRQLLWMRPDLAVEEIRGNVPTRLRKLCDSSELDAIVLAQAGLDRLGFSPNEGILDFENERLKLAVLNTLPAIGQGAIALEARANDKRARQLLGAINHEPTFCCIRAERELLRLLNGDCELPVGVRTELLDGARMRIQAVVFDDDDEALPHPGETEGDARTPEALAGQVFEQLRQIRD